MITPTPEEPLEAGDELLFVALPEAEDALRSAVLAAVLGRGRRRRRARVTTRKLNPTAAMNSG